MWSQGAPHPLRQTFIVPHSPLLNQLSRALQTRDNLLVFLGKKLGLKKLWPISQRLLDGFSATPAANLIVIP